MTSQLANSTGQANTMSIKNSFNSNPANNTRRISDQHRIQRLVEELPRNEGDRVDITEAASKQLMQHIEEVISIDHYL